MNDSLELWQTHSAIDSYLLQHLPEAGLTATPASGGHNVGQMFAHINDLRLRWVDNAAPDLTANLAWFEKQPDRTIDASQLQAALTASAEAVATLVARCTEAGCGVKDFPGSVVSFVGYLIAHEAYHWGEMGLALNDAGLPLDREVALGIWRGWRGRATPAP